MIEVITEETIGKYIGYLTDIQLSNVQRIGLAYGDIPAGACVIQEKDASIVVDGICLDSMVQTQLTDELLGYLAEYAEETNAIYIELMVDDDALKETLEARGFRFQESATSYECTLDTLVHKERFEKMMALRSETPKDAEVYSFAAYTGKHFPEQLRWVLHTPDLWKEASYLLVKDKQVCSFCAVARRVAEDGGDEICLSYLYARGPKYLPAVTAASTETVLKAVHTDAKFTFSAINQESALFAKGIGFERNEIRSICYKGVMSTMRVKDINLRKEVLL